MSAIKVCTPSAGILRVRVARFESVLGGRNSGVPNTPVFGGKGYFVRVRPRKKYGRARSHPRNNTRPHRVAPTYAFHNKGWVRIPLQRVGATGATSYNLQNAVLAYLECLRFKAPGVGYYLKQPTSANPRTLQKQ